MLLGNRRVHSAEDVSIIDANSRSNAGVGTSLVIFNSTCNCPNNTIGVICQFKVNTGAPTRNVATGMPTANPTLAPTPKQNATSSIPPAGTGNDWWWIAVFVTILLLLLAIFMVMLYCKPAALAAPVPPMPLPTALVKELATLQAADRVGLSPVYNAFADPGSPDQELGMVTPGVIRENYMYSGNLEWDEAGSINSYDETNA